MTLYNVILYVSELVYKSLILLVPLLIAVSYTTLAERKIIGWMQLRKGPNTVGVFGLLQPIADAIKLLTKEVIIPSESNKLLFLIAPVITASLAFMGWAIIPVGDFCIANINIAVMYFMAISSLAVYGIIIAGWSSNSAYPFLGAIRAVSQMISYEIPMGICIASIVLLTGTMNLSQIASVKHAMPWYVDICIFPLMVVFFITMLAETNRHPFDLPEAESELVAGYQVEYSSMTFALFFLGEYANMILMSAICATMFLGGGYPPFGLDYFTLFQPSVAWFIFKITTCLFCFIWIRASLPRYRCDQLMKLGWKYLFPISLFYFIFIAVLVLEILPSA